MGRIKKGILGGLSGQVGTVIGGSWKGISYIRAQALPGRAFNFSADASHWSVLYWPSHTGYGSGVIELIVATEDEEKG